MKRENEKLLKNVKEDKRKIEVTQDKLNDLEQYGCNTMLEINRFPRMEIKTLGRLCLLRPRGSKLSNSTVVTPC